MKQKMFKMFPSAHKCPKHLECKLEWHIMFKLEAWYTFENLISRDITKVTCANLDMLWAHYSHLKIDIIIVPKLTTCPKSLGNFVHFDVIFTWSYKMYYKKPKWWLHPNLSCGESRYIVICPCIISISNTPIALSILVCVHWQDLKFNLKNPSYFNPKVYACPPCPIARIKKNSPRV
jgi:hypothetical protein